MVKPTDTGYAAGVAKVPKPQDATEEKPP